ncbi:MAG: carbohydrate kinase family protein [Peptoniphilus sp.]|nr:carbohydrate kinase family protein [Peptoniphilus sp.]MDD7362814.1 carbohydrate kinase family protein [Bacillota bacterium]MDY6043994.1 carbohydrate kinase family protein [Peptoniphilus sp.]
MREPRVAVFGGCNLDISGRCLSRQHLYDSNPGIVTMTPGGVGRNIAANIASAGVETTLVTALGDDDKKEMILASAPACLSFDDAFVFRGESTGSYLAVLDDRGELYTAVNDMRIIDRLTAEKLASRRALAERCRYTVVDANLSAEALAEIFSWSIRAVVDGVSAVKVEKFKAFIDRINVLKCNILEARALSGLGENARLIDCGADLLRKGAERVVITAGADGAYVFSKSETIHFKTSAMEIQGATGAGDAFVGMLTAELVEGKNFIDATIGAMAASRLVLKSDDSDLRGFHREAWEREKQEVDYDII